MRRCEDDPSSRIDCVPLTATGEALIRLDGYSVTHVDRAPGGESAFTIDAVWRFPGFGLHSDKTTIRRLRHLDFLGEVVVTRRAEAMCQTAGGGIDPGCVSIGFFAEPARLPCFSIVMHQPTEMTDQKYRAAM